VVVKENVERDDYMLEMVFSGVFALILLGFIFFGLQIPHQSNPADLVEASGFPLIFAILALGLLVWEIFSRYRTLRKAGATEDAGSFDIKQVPKVAVIIAMSIIYIVFVGSLGFTILSLVFLFIAMNLLGSKKQWVNALFSVLTVAALVLVFGKFFGISLPRGAGIFRELSFYLY